MPLLLRQPAPRVWLRPLLLLGVVMLLLLGLSWWQRPDGRLHVLFLDTPGDAALILTPRGGAVLLDGGADPVALALHLGERLPFWQRNLEAVVLTQGGAQRLPGQIAALERYHAGLALAPATLPDTGPVREWRRLLEEQHTPLHVAQPGDRLALGGALLTVLAAEATGEDGLVLRLDYGATSVLFGGASSNTHTAALLAQARPVTVLAYPWQREPDAPLLAAWQPRAVVFTTAYEQQQPAQRTFFERAHDIPLYHPELDGTIELVSDGQTACIRREHDPPCRLAAE
jgi:beta-lactamase superfamily II metal-dependent hydrolase